MGDQRVVRSLLLFPLLLVGFVVLTAQKSFAVPIFGGTNIGSLSFGNGIVDSYDDLKDFDLIGGLQAGGFASNSFLAFDTFTLDETVNFSLTTLGGAGDWFDQHQFGVLDSGGNFISLVDGGTNGGLGDSVSATLGPGDYTFFFSSPDGGFSSIASDNADNSNHIVGQQVLQDGTISFNPATLNGGTFSFDLLTDDLLFFLEDLINGPSSINQAWCDMGMCDTGDNDFQDRILVLRTEPIPEPATMLLLGLGTGAVVLRRRRREREQLAA